MFNFFKKTDADIQADVNSALKWDQRLTSTKVTATVNEGIVTLRGSVPHYFEKTSAEDIAQRVGGVRAVADEMEVNIMGSYDRTDEDIARAASNALDWNVAVPEGITVVVEKGWVTLKGQVDWDYQRYAAKNSVTQLMGVCGVINNITMKPKVLAADVKTRIEDALKRSAKTESRKIAVEVKGNAVTLSGNVHSPFEIADARFAAWNAPGVMSVESKMHVSQ